MIDKEKIGKVGFLLFTIIGILSSLLIVYLNFNIVNINYKEVICCVSALFFFRQLIQILRGKYD
ncbi:hypothetical protein [Kaistella sp.]|uniref:hypothetical protein n=1 Tax=Kaistella sp. TaxID=2782235 RepID=UPI003C544CFE